MGRHAQGHGGGRQSDDIEPPHWLGGVSRAEGPLHAQIGDVIEQAIDSGDLQPGDRLPPERELAAWFGVNRLTLRQALSDLGAPPADSPLRRTPRRYVRGRADRRPRSVQLRRFLRAGRRPDSA